MTVNSTLAYQRTSGDGLTVNFSVPFALAQADQLIVELVHKTAGIATAQMLDVDYTLVIAADGQSATIAMIMPPPATHWCVRRRRALYVQPTHLLPHGRFPADMVELAIDRQAQDLQVLRDSVMRSIRLNDSDVAFSKPLPAIDALAGKYLGFDNDGNPTGFEGQGGSAALTSYLAAGSGAVSRSVQDKLREIPSVKDFMARGDGYFDDTDAIQRAVDSFGDGKGELYFPAGHYKVDGGPIRVAQGSIHLRGAGPTVTNVFTTRPNKSLFKFSGTTFDSMISGMRLYFHGANPLVDLATAGAAIEQTDGVGVIQVVFVRIEHNYMGIDCRNTPNSGVSGVVVVSHSSIANCVVDGIFTDGISQLFTQAVTIYHRRYSGNAGIHGRHGGGFYINNTTCGGMDYGLLFDPPAGRNLTDIYTTNYESDTCNLDGVVLDASGGGNITTALLLGSRAGYCMRHGLVLNGANLKDVRVVGNAYQKNGQHGILIVDGKGIEVVATHLLGNSSLVAGCNGVTVVGGEDVAIRGGKGDVYKTEPPTHSFNLSIQESFNGTLLVDGFNARTGYQDGSIFNGSASSKVKIVNSPGFNPRGRLLPGLASTLPAEYTAGPSDECIILEGGSTTAIKVNGQVTLLQSPCTFTLPAGMTMRVEGSVSPNLVVIGA